MPDKIKKISRNIGIDILRIISGFAVVAIHVSDSFVGYPNIFGGLSWQIANLINSTSRISVPLFIMISGFLVIKIYKNRPFDKFMKGRLSRLLPPFIFWVAFYFAWPLIFFGKTINIKNVIQSFVGANIGHLYFLLVIIQLTLITPLISYFADSNKKEKKYFLFLTFIFGILIALINVFIPSAIYKENILNKGIIFIGYYFAGYFLSELKISFKQVKILGLIFLISAGLNGWLNYIATNWDLNHRFFFLSKGFNQYFYTPYSPFIIIMTLSLFLIFTNLDFEKILSRFKIKTESVSRFSGLIFGVYLVHPLLVDFLDKYANLKIDKILSPIWFYLILKLILTIMLSVLLITLLKKIPLLKKTVGYK